MAKHSGVNDESPMHKMHKMLEKLKEEFFAVLSPTIFFFVALEAIFPFDGK